MDIYLTVVLGNKITVGLELPSILVNSLHKPMLLKCSTMVLFGEVQQERHIKLDFCFMFYVQYFRNKVIT